MFCLELYWRQEVGWIFFCLFPTFTFFFVFFLEEMGSRALGSPTRIESFDQGQEMGMYYHAAARKGSGKPLPWPFGPHVAVINKR